MTVAPPAIKTTYEIAVELASLSMACRCQADNEPLDKTRVLCVAKNILNGLDHEVVLALRDIDNATCFKARNIEVHSGTVTFDDVTAGERLRAKIPEEGDILHDLVLQGLREAEANKRKLYEIKVVTEDTHRNIGEPSKNGYVVEITPVVSLASAAENK